MKTDTVVEETLVLCKHKCTHCINASLGVIWYQDSVWANTISSVCGNKRWYICQQLIIIWVMLCWLFSWASPLFKNKKEKEFGELKIQWTRYVPLHHVYCSLMKERPWAEDRPYKSICQTPKERMGVLLSVSTFSYWRAPMHVMFTVTWCP